MRTELENEDMLDEEDPEVQKLRALKDELTAVTNLMLEKGLKIEDLNRLKERYKELSDQVAEIENEMLAE